MATLLFVALIGGPHFQVDRPEGWEVVSSSDAKLHLRTEGAEIQVFAVQNAPVALDALAKWWQSTMEIHIKKDDVVSRKTRKGTLDGAGCLVHEIRMKTGRLTWMVARRGSLAYAVHIHRLTDRVDDEIGALLASIKLLAKPAAAKPDPNPVKPVPKREKLTSLSWRFRCVKPAGLTRSESFDASEKANGVVARFDAVGEQSRLMIRIYARRGRMDVKRQAEVRIRQFEQRYRKRKPPIIDSNWKVPLARRTRHLRLAALDGLKKVEDWYFADGRNGCSYEIQIYRSGPERWERQVSEFLKNFVPTRKTARSRMAG